MPYQNQKLTSSERRDLLRYRIDNGYPLHAPPHLIREEGYFLITAATHQHSVVLDTPKRRSLFEVQLINELQVAKAEVTAWVVLPNHYHVLLSVPNLNQISSAIRLLHGRTSRRWNLEDSLTNQRKVWFEWSDRAIRGVDHFYRALNYIHYNPVKHGFTTDPYSWTWSSLQLYEESEGREWLRKKWKEYLPDQIGQGWDDFE